MVCVSVCGLCLSLWFVSLSITGGGWDAGAGVLEEGGMGGRGDRNFFFIVYIGFRFGVGGHVSHRSQLLVSLHGVFSRRDGP